MLRMRPRSAHLSLVSMISPCGKRDNRPWLADVLEAKGKTLRAMYSSMIEELLGWSHCEQT
jgi:hypothetical protein